MAKLAARRALAEEMAISPLMISGNDNPGLDFRNKYQALIGLLRWCSFVFN
jgi:hypothetical protein